MDDKYILYILLHGKKAVQCNDPMTWAKWFVKADRQVAKDTFGDVVVSTVFLGLDYSFGSGPPILFETKVFGGALNQKHECCSTWDEAEEMHSAMVERVKAETSKYGNITQKRR